MDYFQWTCGGCRLESGSSLSEGASNGLLIDAVDASGMEATIVECEFQNFDSPSTIVAFVNGGDVDRLLNRSNTPTAWT